MCDPIMWLVSLYYHYIIKKPLKKNEIRMRRKKVSTKLIDRFRECRRVVGGEEGIERKYSNK